MQLHQKSPKVAMVESNIQHKFSFNHRILFYMLFLALAFLSDLNVLPTISWIHGQGPWDINALVATCIFRIPS